MPDLRSVFQRVRLAQLHDFNVGGYNDGEVEDLGSLLVDVGRLLGRLIDQEDRPTLTPESAQTRPEPPTR